MKCPKCDLEVKKNFCAKCGHQVSSDYQSKSTAKFLIILGMTVLGLFGLLISAGIVSATYQSFGGGLADLFGFIFLGPYIAAIVLLTRKFLKDLDQPDKKSSDSYCMQCGVKFLDEEDLQFCTNCGSKKKPDVKEDEREDFFTL